jgi:hypothetical protein
MKPYYRAIMTVENSFSKKTDVAAALDFLSKDHKDWLCANGYKELVADLSGGKYWMAEEGFKSWLFANGYGHWLVQNGYVEWFVMSGNIKWLAENDYEDWLAANGYIGWLANNGYEDFLLENGFIDYLEANDFRTHFSKSFAQPTINEDAVDTDAFFAECGLEF